MINQGTAFRKVVERLVPKVSNLLSKFEDLIKVQMKILYP